MNAAQVQSVSSRDNAAYKELRRLAQDSTAYRKQARVWLEGEHLCRAALERGVSPVLAVFAESSWAAPAPAWDGLGCRVMVLPDAMMRQIGALESPAPMGFVVELPAAAALDPLAATVVLDRLQDAGNVGSILRCAAAFGFRQVIALKGTAALWSPKVLRAGMGAHFGLALIEVQEAQALDALSVPLLATSSHQGEWLHRASLPWPCAWALGHEGQGLSAEVAGRARHSIRIAQPGGEESLNVAAAAAICMHASAAAHAPTA